MPSAPKWSIRVKSQKAYVFVNGAPLAKNGQEFMNIVRAAAGEYKSHAAIKLIFSPGERGKRGSSYFQMTRFDWSMSDGLFREIIGCADVQAWVKKCNDVLTSLQALLAPSEVPQPDLSVPTEEETSLKRTSASAVLDQLLPTPKKKCSTTKAMQSEEKETEFQKRARECEVGGQFYVPVEKVEVPQAHRMIRKVDEVFLTQLKENMLKHPNGSYEPLFLEVKNIAAPDEFSPNDIASYEYEVLGGTHNVIATKQLLEEHPERAIFKGRYARLFVGLRDEEALWLASRHNSSGCFRHEMTFQDEVDVARRQLQCLGAKESADKYSPNQRWRDSCSHILGKTKKNLSEVFAIAVLPEDGYRAFVDVCHKYAKGLLKEQRAMSKDLKGKPAFKASYIKSMLGLEVCDRITVLNQLAEQTISLDEFKKLSKELKSLRPVQKIISSFLGKKWEELEDKLGECVTPEQLKKFSGKDETNVVFRQYLAFLQTCLEKSGNADPTSVVASPNLFMIDEFKAIVHMCTAPLNLEQGSYGQENKGFSLAMYRLPEQQEDYDVTKDAASMLELMDRLQFGVCQIYNVAILGTIENLVPIQKMIQDTRGPCEMGYICINGIKPSGGHGMVKSVEGFLVHHAAIGHRVLPEHFNFGSTSQHTNFIIAEEKSRHRTTCNQLVELFSRPGDWVLDVNIPEVAGVVAAVQSKRNGLCLVANEDAQQRARNTLRELLN